MVSAAKYMLKTEGLVGLYRSFPVTLLTNIPYGMVMVSTNETLKQQLTEDGKRLDLSTCLLSSSVAGMMAAATTTPLDRIKTFLQTQQLQPACDVGKCPKLSGPPLTLQQAIKVIAQQEGAAGFFKGLGPRVVTHTPAVAISWTTYETAKQWLASL